MPVVAACQEYLDIDGIGVIPERVRNRIDKRALAAAARTIEKQQLLFRCCADEQIARPFLHIGAFLLIGDDLRDRLRPEGFFSDLFGAVFCAGNA